VLKNGKGPPFFVGRDLSRPNRKEVVAGVMFRSVEDGGVMKQKSKGGGGWRDRAGGWVRQGHEAKPCLSGIEG